MEVCYISKSCERNGNHHSMGTLDIFSIQTTALTAAKLGHYWSGYDATTPHRPGRTHDDRDFRLRLLFEFAT
jgi:hypothetical protein